MRPTVLVLEDVHWADEATLDIFRLLARRAEALGALVVVTYRDDELERTHPVRIVVGELGDGAGVGSCVSPPLSREAVGRLAGPRGLDPEELHLQHRRQPVLRHRGARGRRATSVPRDRARRRARPRGAARPAARGRARRGGGRAATVELVAARGVVGDAVVDGSTRACASGMLRSDGRSRVFRHELARLASRSRSRPAARVELHRARARGARGDRPAATLRPRAARPSRRGRRRRAARCSSYATGGGGARGRARARTARPRHSTRERCGPEPRSTRPSGRSCSSARAASASSPTSIDARRSRRPRRHSNATASSATRSARAMRCGALSRVPLVPGPDRRGGAQSRRESVAAARGPRARAASWGRVPQPRRRARRG